MSTKRIAAGLLTTLACFFVSSPAGAAEPQPAWNLDVTSLPTNFAPGVTGSLGKGPEYLVVATNVGGKATTGPIVLTDTLPQGIVPIDASPGGGSDPGAPEPTCAIEAERTVICTDPGPFRAGFTLEIKIVVRVEPVSPQLVTNEATIEGGGAATVSEVAPTQVGATATPFSFLPGDPGFSAPVFEADGLPTTAAGSHPYALSVKLGFPTENPDGPLIAAGHLHDAEAALPAGMIADPAATGVRCTKAQLITGAECPEASQIGYVTVTSFISSPQTVTSPLYNMVPPPGKAAEFGFNAIGVGVYTHIFGSVKSNGQFELAGDSYDVLAQPAHPIFGVRINLWGDPTDPSHNAMRRECVSAGAPGCPPRQSTAFLTAPGRCGQATTTVGRADSWEEPGLFKEATYQSADLAGNPVSLSGCAALRFEPTLSAQPTTNLADSPSGLDVELHQPQDTELGAGGEGRSTAQLKDATVTLPAGMSVNPSQANGLDACGASQIGLLTAAGAAPVHFSEAPAGCPDASRLGTVEVTTPLLIEYGDEGTKPLHDPETGAVIPRPLHGSLYLAKPFENPFDSLLAIYLVVEDPESGTVAKLAGRIEADPQTGRLTTRFAENPQLPLEDVRLHLFGGARGSLTTPLTCATHTTTSDLVPWSSPEGQDAHPQSSFQTAGEPGGGSCPASEAAAPNSPSFTAGTLSPQAGAYSPFVLKISREDGSQRLTAIDTTLAPGLLGKLAGIDECTEAQIAQAEGRGHPEEGRLERESPSCPASSQVGTVTVGAGSGPTPFYTSGRAYLAGPYKGAPVSLAVITPAIAGPFDLGTVVTRVALRVDPETTQIHAVSDPLPTILDGIPLDVRSVALAMDRPGFTLNPTSCDPLQITGSATSSLGQGVALGQRFQVGGCSSLKFKPKLSLRLKGKVRRTAHPRLIATLKAKQGEANVASAQVKLPPAAFIDQGHIRGVCTRVQWAADTCPAGSVYGAVKATTPLLSYPLTGSVYLRSSSNVLPDLVAKLKGPASQPIEIDLDGRTDSVKGALRNTFEAVPDAPVSSFRLELFGGKRGLVEMSSGFCGNRHATVALTGQNGKAWDTRPVVAAKCPKSKKKGHGKHHGHHRKHHHAGARSKGGRR